MEKLLTASQMKQCDKTASLTYKIPPLVLMERAALETVKILLANYGSDISVGIVAGCGNNGGDGIAAARILKEYGVYAAVHLIGDRQKCSPETNCQLETAKKLQIPVYQGFTEDASYDVLVDALFGIGLTRRIEGVYYEVIQAINASGAKVVAIDIPSGIHSDSGRVMGTAVRADITVTYAYRKLGHILYPGAEYAGKVFCVPIGIPAEALEEAADSVITYGRQDLQLPQRKKNGNKGSFGKVLLVAGSKTMGGACSLSAQSAFRIGAGMVRVFTAKENRELLLKTIPEVMVDTYDDEKKGILTEEEKAILQKGMQWADVIAVGPGLSVSEKAASIAEAVLQTCDKPLVLDADALNILSKKQELLQQLENADGRRDIVVTPHLGEFARLTGTSVSELSEDILGCCRAFVKKYDVTLVCKDARTLVAKQNHNTYVNTSGNDGMATAGSGDVLTGIIAGLMAQGMEGCKAAALGVYVHGLAGDDARNRTSEYFLMAQDIIRSLRYLSGTQT